MTIDERFERIEHVTAGLAEEGRKEREESRQLWRDTQRQIGQLTAQIAALAQESREADRRLGERIESVDQRLGERIEALVSAMGEFIARQQKP
jgi:hypothetical protein